MTMFICSVIFLLFLLSSFGFYLKLRITLSSSFWISAASAVITVSIAQVCIQIVNEMHPVTQLCLFSILYGIIALLIILSRFFRDPERDIPYSDNALVSPADGTVLYIKRLEKGVIPQSVKNGRNARIDELLQTDSFTEGKFIIGIEMNILNVHVNRSPVDGTVTFKKHIPGRFLSLRDENAPVQNERLTTVIDQGEFKIAVIQIASRLVRRIDSYIQTGDIITMGDRIGMIKFGSQVDVIVPDLQDMKFNIDIGDEVAAGTTILATFTP